MAALLAETPDMWQSCSPSTCPTTMDACQACRDSAGAIASRPHLTRQVATEANYIYEGGLPNTFTGRHARG